MLGATGSGLGRGSALATGRQLAMGTGGATAEMGGPGRGRMGTGFRKFFWGGSLGCLAELTTTITWKSAPDAGQH